MNHKGIYLLVFLIIFMNSCISPYNPDISKYENIFVVDGELTNLPGPYHVKLSRSFKYDESSGDPVSGALVKIIDNTGKEAELKETGNGIYSTIDSTFQGIVGQSYKLQIKLNDEIYESEFETLKRPIPIDRVYWEYRVADNSDADGIQLLLDTHDSTNGTRYYAWNYDETWKFRVPIDVVDKPEWKVCYKSLSKLNLDVGTTINRIGDIIEKHPLLFIDGNTNRLFIRYTMLVRQFTLSEQTYKFFNSLITINQNQGTLFDPMPYSLVGNVKSLSNKDLPVLGYFLVAGASGKRIFIDRSDLPEDFNPTDGFDGCNTENAIVPWTLRNDIRQDPKVDSLMRLGYSVLDKNNSCTSLGPDPCTAKDSVVIVYMAKPYCFNCTLNGTNKVPDFWKEKDSN